MIAQKITALFRTFDFTNTCQNMIDESKSTTPADVEIYAESLRKRGHGLADAHTHALRRHRLRPDVQTRIYKSQ
jgi:hypothetical protein